MKKATVKIKVTFKQDYNKEYDSTFKFILGKSPCFEYGNGTSVVIERYFDNGRRGEDKLLDTRYVKIGDFREFCLGWLRENYKDHDATIVECKEWDEPEAESKVTLTDLEKRILREAVNSDFFQEHSSDPFLCWGEELKISGDMTQKRGALSSLVKKGVLRIVEDGSDIKIFRTNAYTNTDIAFMAGTYEKV